MTAAIDITTGQRKTLLALLRRFIPGVAVWAYGSRVKWTARPNSDLDLVAFTTPAQGHLVSELKEAFAESNLPFLVDFHVWDEVPERFLEIIRKEYVVLQEAEEKREDENLRNLTPLDDLTEDETPITYGVVKPGEEGDVPFVRGGDIAGGRVLMNQLRTIGGEVSQQYRRTLLRGGEILVSLVGNPGQVAIAPPELAGANIARQVGLVRLKPGIDSRFVSYFLQSREGQTALGAHSIGSVQQVINLRDLKTVKVPLPPLSEQKNIAHILGTLDDKIELNRRMNTTLEAMARALFQSWFVDYDPVRAKTERRDPCFPKPITDLFPDSFEDSELGEIPNGWVVAKLGDVLSQRVERCVPSAETAARPYVPIDCISPRSLFLTESKPGEEAQSSLTKFYKGDLLFGAMRPYFHKVCIAPFDGTTRTTAFVLYPRQADDFAFATLLLHHPDTIDFATRHSTGSTIPYAVWAGSLEDMPVLVPPAQVRKAFNNVVRPILGRIPEPYFENRTLATLRDALLPKLLSGELSVSNVKEEVASV